MGLLRRRPEREVSEGEIVRGSRTVADRLDEIADRLEDAVARLAAEIEDSDDRLDDDEGRQ